MEPVNISFIMQYNISSINCIMHLKSEELGYPRFTGMVDRELSTPNNTRKMPPKVMATSIGE